MGGLSWSPNGKTLAFAQRDPDDYPRLDYVAFASRLKP
jgi:hypothetical protein